MLLVVEVVVLVLLVNEQLLVLVPVAVLDVEVVFVTVDDVSVVIVEVDVVTVVIAPVESPPNPAQGSGYFGERCIFRSLVVSKMGDTRIDPQIL